MSIKSSGTGIARASEMGHLASKASGATNAPRGFLFWTGSQYAWRNAVNNAVKLGPTKFLD